MSRPQGRGDSWTEERLYLTWAVRRNWYGQRGTSDEGRRRLEAPRRRI
jgi:hypothetical protein